MGFRARGAKQHGTRIGLERSGDVGKLGRLINRLQLVDAEALDETAQAEAV
jgi:hypothetical protein